jgi:Ca2+-transporting ATPase
MPEPSVKFYNLSIDETLRQLDTSHHGLTSHEAKRRLGYYGINKLPEAKPRYWWQIFYEQFTSPLIIILILAASVSLIMAERVDATVIFMAVLIQVIVGFIQEFKAQQSLEALKRVITLQARVRREQTEQLIPATTLVPGDVVLLQAGDKIPADARLIETGDFEVNEAALTGESEPILKEHKKIHLAEVTLADRTNMVFAGTVATKGTALALVTHTGEFTELGKIAKLIKNIETEPTPLQKQLALFAKRVSILVVLIAVVIFVAGFFAKNNIVEMFTVAVAVAVSAIPEGLAIAVTIILAVGMRRILKQKALVRKLVAAETLGSTNVICTDKTGTLTEGNMQVTEIVTWEDVLTDLKHKTAAQVLRVGLLCNDARVNNPNEPANKWVISGNLTERALLQAAVQSGWDLAVLIKEAPRVDTMPFDSTIKHMATLHREAQGRTLYVKGAPEIITAKCTKIQINGRAVPFDADKQAQFEKKFIALSKKGLRIIALAYKVIAKANTVAEAEINDLVLMGYVGIRDPLRAEAKRTIALCQRAGIKIVMITGDHKLTAQTIAHELGLACQAHNVMEGSELDTLSQHELNKRVGDIIVYARVTPEHKLRIVQAWQANGQVVAMTGDGINDSPAIKAADIGVALGSGTDVAKETANLVILDDNFSTIVAAVEEGRGIFDNIKKTVLYLISDSFSEVILITGSLLVGLPIPITAAQILWINIVDDTFPSLAMTQEPKEPASMLEPPRGHSNYILTREIKWLIAVVSLTTGLLNLVLFYYLYHAYGNIQPAQTIIFASFGIDSLIFMFTLRSLRVSLFQLKPWSNRWLVGALGVGILAQLLPIYIPWLQPYFHTVALDAWAWGIIGALIFVELMIIEVSKYFIIKSKITAL